MDIRLVPDVPDDLVFGHVEDIVQRNGEFGDAQRAAEVAAGAADGVDDISTELFAELTKLGDVEVFQVHWIVDGVQQRGWGLTPPVVDLVNRKLVKKVVVLVRLVMGDRSNGALEVSCPVCCAASQAATCGEYVSSSSRGASLCPHGRQR